MHCYKGMCVNICFRGHGSRGFRLSAGLPASAAPLHAYGAGAHPWALQCHYAAVKSGSRIELAVPLRQPPQVVKTCRSLDKWRCCCFVCIAATKRDDFVGICRWRSYVQQESVVCGSMHLHVGRDRPMNGGNVYLLTGLAQWSTGTNVQCSGTMRGRTGGLKLTHTTGGWRACCPRGVLGMMPSWE